MGAIAGLPKGDPVSRKGEDFFIFRNRAQRRWRTENPSTLGSRAKYRFFGGVSCHLGDEIPHAKDMVSLIIHILQLYLLYSKYA